MTQTRFLLPEDRIPRAWANILPDLPGSGEFMLHPGTRKPLGPEDLGPLFGRELALQEFSREREIEIPAAVRDVYRLWRPTPLIRAVRLEQALGTPAHIYFKYEGVSPVGSHKANSAVPQAYYNKQEGIDALTTETGAGQWGSALAMACNFFKMDLEIYMVRSSFHQKPYRRIIMESFGAQVFESPSLRTEAGRKFSADPANARGSLGIAISEAVEAAVLSGGRKKYALGSVLNHVILHQTVIGLETREQMALAGEAPDVLVGCAGGGSNFGGFVVPFVQDKLKGRPAPTIIAVEPAACPSLTKGRLDYDFGDSAQMTPLLRMHSLGHVFLPPELHAGGLRYHGMSPIVSAMLEQGLVEARAVPQTETFASALTFARAEGIIPAPESSHAVHVAIAEALACRERNERKVIVFNLSGHGHFDMAAYERYLTGQLEG